ncbi:MAG: FAD-dependent oxidoreductase [Polyangiales bacterium]
MRKVEVLRAESLSPSVRSLVLACADGAPLQYLPGQWINLQLDCAGVLDKRPYSIASAPSAEHPERFEIAVTRVDPGRVSQSLHALQPGAVLELDGPYGFFSREGLEQEPTLLVGTGTGVSPLRAMIEAELGSRADGPPLTLLFGCRTRDDLLYAGELEALAQAHPRFVYEPTLSRADDAWAGRRGYVQTHVAELVSTLGRPHVFVCGLSDMVNEVRVLLKETLGYDRKHIHTERYD